MTTLGERFKRGAAERAHKTKHDVSYSEGESDENEDLRCYMKNLIAERNIVAPLKSSNERVSSNHGHVGATERESKSTNHVLDQTHANQTQEKVSNNDVCSSTLLVGCNEMPPFDMTDFVSPIDRTGTFFPTPVAIEKTLRVNRRQGTVNKESTFDQLLKPMSSSPTVCKNAVKGFSVLEEKQNPADTTRHYAGGNLRRHSRGRQSVVGEVGLDSEWVTEPDSDTCVAETSAQQDESQRRRQEENLQETILEKNDQKTKSKGERQEREQREKDMELIEKQNLVKDLKAKERQEKHNVEQGEDCIQMKCQEKEHEEELLQEKECKEGESKKKAYEDKERQEKKNSEKLRQEEEHKEGEEKEEEEEEEEKACEDNEREEEDVIGKERQDKITLEGTEQETNVKNTMREENLSKEMVRQEMKVQKQGEPEKHLKENEKGHKEQERYEREHNKKNVEGEESNTEEAGQMKEGQGKKNRDEERYARKRKEANRYEVDCEKKRQKNKGDEVVIKKNKVGVKGKQQNTGMAPITSTPNLPEKEDDLHSSCESLDSSTSGSMVLVSRNIAHCWTDVPVTHKNSEGNMSFEIVSSSEEEMQLLMSQKEKRKHHPTERKTIQKKFGKYVDWDRILSGVAKHSPNRPKRDVAHECNSKTTEKTPPHLHSYDSRKSASPSKRSERRLRWEGYRRKLMTGSSSDEDQSECEGKTTPSPKRSSRLMHHSDKRCSRRKRLAPTLFWLGQRVEYRTLVNGTREVVKVGSVPAAIETKVRKVRKKNLQSKTSESGDSKQNHPQQIIKSPQCSIPSSSESLGSTVQKEPVCETSSPEALTCYPDDIVMRNKNHGLVQETDKVKIAQCVSTKGMRGGCLELDVGASIGDQVATKYSTMYFVLKGSVNVEINKKSQRFPTGSFFIIKNGSRFNITNITSTKASLTYCDHREGYFT